MTLVVDMSRSTFCDCAGSATLLRAYQRATGMNAHLRLVITKPTLRRVFELTGLDQVLEIRASLEAADNNCPRR